jgi:hypothetical protein
MRNIAKIQPGDILYVSRGLYKHYGIYAGDGKVIHFAPLAGAEINAENAVIHETSLENFLKDGTLAVDKKAKAKFSRQKIVERARSQIGSKKYDLVFNNCEHFARWCKTGIYESNQVNSAIDIVVEGVAYAAELINGSENPKRGKRLLSKLTDYLS